VETLKEERVKKIKCEDNTVSANWMYCIIIPGLDFQNLEEYMNEKMVQIRPFFYDIRKHSHLQDIKVDYPELEIKDIMLPSYPGLKKEQQEYIINYLNEYLKISFYYFTRI